MGPAAAGKGAPRDPAPSGALGRRGRRRGDDLVQRVAQPEQPGGGLRRLMVRALYVEGVDRHPALRPDPCEGAVETEIEDPLGQPVQDPDLIPRLDLDDRALHRDLVVDLDGGGERAVEGLAAVRVDVPASFRPRAWL